ncbi:DUF4115 domain-containing protein [Novosphingobium pokkalii]|uniref:DUF4115 domain-containing protein n=1 Tax=Novosphingobium pokkalii TaxID=1770194 RepID=UPI003628C03F
MVFTAQEDRIWVKFYDGTGKQLVQKLMAKGETYTLPDGVSDPKLWTGRPDALAITIGGQAVPRLADKQGIMKDVDVSAPALWARADRQTAAPADGAGAAASSTPNAAPSPAHHQARRRVAAAVPAASGEGAAATAPATTPEPAPSPAN